MKAKEILNTRTEGATEWAVVEEGTKYITVRFRSLWEGAREPVFKYRKEDRAEVVEIFEKYQGASARVAIEEIGYGPKIIKQHG